MTFAPGCACEHWTLVGHVADAYHYDAGGELAGHHPDCPDYVAPTPEEQERGRAARAARAASLPPLRLPDADFTVEDFGRKLTVNWRQRERRSVQVGVRFVDTRGAYVGTKDHPLLVELDPGEVLVIRTEEPAPAQLLTMNVDGFLTGA